jgi:hypothetical protein
VCQLLASNQAPTQAAAVLADSTFLFEAVSFTLITWQPASITTGLDVLATAQQMADSMLDSSAIQWLETKSKG